MRTIRWKLVTSYVILAVVTVSLVGLIAQEIVRRYGEQQQMAQLQANARAVAEQAAPLMAPVVRLYDLSQLVESTSYLGNLRVQVLDSSQRLLVDSGLPSRPNEYVIIQSPSSTTSQPLFQSGVLIPDWLALPMKAIDSDARLRESMLHDLPPGTSWIIIRRIETPWGTRVSFVESSEIPSQETDSTTQDASNSVPRSELSWQEPIKYKQYTIGYVDISAGPNLAEGTLTASRQAFLLAGIGAGLLAILLGLFISNRIAAPINELKSAAGLMGTGDLAVRATVHSEDEIGSLAQQFNTMADQLQSSFNDLAAERDTLQRFIADASHELRTPITALKNFITLLQDTEDVEPDVKAEFLAESQAQIDRLEWITSNLLDLSRLDAGLMTMEFAPHSLGELVETSVAPFTNLAEIKEIQLEINMDNPDIEFECDITRLEIACSNLIDNAMKFTPAGGRVSVTATASEDQIQVAFSDTGSGIAVEELPHIYERFYRGNHPEIPGSGLGLAIVQSVIRAHQGTIEVDSTPGVGTTFTVYLPKIQPLP
jgi:signal transduction histidine kinase